MWNTIAELQRIVVKPKKWITYRGLDGDYNLYFSMVDNDKNSLCWVQNSRGKKKGYRRLEAVYKDVLQVDPNGILHVCSSLLMQPDLFE